MNIQTFRRIVHNQIIAFLDKHNLFSSRQVGYKKWHSTQSALLELTDEVKLGIDRGELTLLILFDLTKAFNTVNHALLYNKLGLVSNENKTEAIIFGSNCNLTKLKQRPIQDLFVNNVKIGYSNSVRYLGLVLESNLS